MSTVVYLYGYAPADAELPADGLLGIADRTVELLPVEGFRAVISDAPAEVYAADALEQRLEDLEWVAGQGMRHEEVVAWFVDHARIIPTRLFTLYSSREAVAREASARAAQVSAQLERFAGLRQWDLKASYSARELIEHVGEVSDEVAELDERIEAAAPGRRFLLQKKRRELAERETARAARRLARDLLSALREFADEVATVDLPREAAELPVVLSAALLVSREREPALRDAVSRRTAELDRIGLRVEFTGPWAPYRFLGDAA